MKPEDLEAYGLIPELIGRLPVIAPLDALGVDDIIHILQSTKGSLVQQFRKLVKFHGADLMFTNNALNEIARIALNRGVGARGLRSLIEEVLEGVLFEVEAGVRYVITDRTVRGGEAVKQSMTQKRASLSKRLLADLHRGEGKDPGCHAPVFGSMSVTTAHAQNSRAHFDGTKAPKPCPCRGWRLRRGIRRWGPAWILAFLLASTVGGRYELAVNGVDVHHNARQSDGDPKSEETTMRRQMRRFMLTAAVLGLMAGAGPRARADLSTFAAAGEFQDGATLGGTMTIDTTAGIVTAVDLTVTAPDSLAFTFVQAQESFEGIYTIQTGTAASGFPDLNLYFPNPSLVGYTGGYIGSGDQTAIVYVSDIYYSSNNQVYLTVGSLTAVPEPSTLLVACVGGVCVIAYGVAKQRRAARTNTRAA